MNKYHNKKTEVNGIIFDSKKESQHYLLLKFQEKTGEIWNLQRQTKIDYMQDGKKIFTYKPDFEYDDETGHHVVDVKGVLTPLFKLKKKLIEAQYKIEIEIV